MTWLLLWHLRFLFFYLSGDEHVRNILGDTELVDQMTDLLNEEAPAPNWRNLAKELKVPREKCEIFEPTEEQKSPTKLFFRSIEKSEPDLTVEELILALVAMKRQDVLDVLAKYLDSKWKCVSVWIGMLQQWVTWPSHP